MHRRHTAAAVICGAHAMIRRAVFFCFIFFCSTSCCTDGVRFVVTMLIWSRPHLLVGDDGRNNRENSSDSSMGCAVYLGRRALQVFTSRPGVWTTPAAHETSDKGLNHFFESGKIYNQVTNVIIRAPMSSIAVCTFGFPPLSSSSDDLMFRDSALP